MGCEHVFVYAGTTWDRGPEHGYITSCTRCGTPGQWVDGEWRTNFETEGSLAIAQLNEVRDLCGGEDPVECLTRIAEMVGYDAEDLDPGDGAPVAVLSEAVERYGDRAPETCDCCEKPAARSVTDLEGTTLCGPCAVELVGSQLRADCDSLLDLVQRLLDHGPGGEDPYFNKSGTPMGNAYVPIDGWDQLREEARAKVAELRKGEDG